MPFVLSGNVGSATAATGYDVANSVRLDGYVSSTRMEATNSSAGSRQIFTFSTWLKRSALDSSTNFQVLYSAVDSGGNERIMFEEDKLTWDFDIAGVDYSVETSGRLYRDFSAWYHIVVTKDTTQSTEANRIKMYVNGVQQTLAEIQLGFPDRNANGSINMAIEHQLFAQADGEEFGGYACETVLIDGTAYAADSFGEFDSDSGIWKPIDVSGLTFGTNGFYMNYANSSALGNDVSGNNNDYTTANLAATDQSTDTCTNNFATLNVLARRNNPNAYYATFSEGNLKLVGNDATNNGNGFSTMAFNTGKWYCEVKIIDVQGDVYPTPGVIPENLVASANSPSNAGQIGYVTDDTVGYGSDGDKLIEDSGSSYGDTYTDNDIIGIAIDCDNGAVYFSKNGTFQASGDPTSGASKTNAAMTFTPSKYYFFGASVYQSTSDVEFNFGAGPPYAISSGNTDGDGFGNFEFAVPSGYFALCSKNLAEYG